MKQRSILAFFVTISILITACSKSGTKPDPVVHPSGDTIIKIKPDTTEDIYVVGSMGIQWGYWKNSQFVALTGSGSKNYTSDMAFSGKDIYVAGSIGDSIGYWKNNQFNFLTKSDSLMPVSITILGSDVYTFLQSEIGPWNGYLYKNNSLYYPVVTTSQPGLTIIYSAGTDLYVPGSDMSIPQRALYWKNGSPLLLTGNGQGSSAYAIAVDNADVYVAGEVYNFSSSSYLATIWKNGVPSYLTDSSTSAGANFISVSNGNVYAAGRVNPGSQHNNTDTISAYVWKNGIASNLTLPTYTDIIYGMAVNGSDVYVSVYSRLKGDVNYFSRYYKNGVPVNYTGISGGFGSRIFVRPR